MSDRISNNGVFIHEYHQVINTKLTNWLSRLTQKDHSDKPSTLYEMVGGEEAVRVLCNRFYDIMESDPKVAALRAIHVEDLAVTRQKFFEFMSGWLGGPALFTEKYGHPRLRARHLHVPVDDKMIEQWLYCMQQALKQCPADEAVKQAVWQNLVPLARHMKNQEDGSSANQSLGLR
ncbi:group II truncated hemoglobin [Aliiglaciecola sp. CAU 1673]|uniref:group II truncated hemoglobin n=1 Tax=Aliiglaciecola sp. CAU 1673 TaxID=3032595 RepID=UPI0023DB0FCD|nr:group II truncated hemoglobin [Aliiglaciecola sp. CAU 1673]MDF2179761.1 group II truncated hemoglobin [Aliiglaciecola sp. CAU 1673]